MRKDTNQKFCHFISTTNGFTLIEIMVALVIFSIVMSALPVAFVSYLSFNSKMENKTGALNIAQQVLDEMRVQDLGALPMSGMVGPETITRNGTDYQISTYYCEHGDYCNSSTSRHIRIEVKQKNKMVYEVQTVFTKLK